MKEVQQVPGRPGNAVPCRRPPGKNREPGRHRMTGWLEPGSAELFVFPDFALLDSSEIAEFC